MKREQNKITAARAGRPKLAERRHVPSAPQGLILSDAAARICGVTSWTICDWARRRKIPTYRPFGPRGRVMFREADLLAFLESTRVEAEPEEGR